MMNYLEKLACRFLIRQFSEGYGTDCKTIKDWEDGMILEESGCGSCKANFVIQFLKEHIELVEFGE